MLTQSTHGLQVVLELANLDDNEGHVVGQRAVAPRSHTVKNGLPHFRKRSFGRLAHQLFQALDAEHVAATVKNLDESVGVKDEAVARHEFNFLRRLGRRGLGETAEDPVLRSEQADSAIGNEHGWRLARGGKSHAPAALTKTGCGHGEKKAVHGDAIVHEVVKML